GVDGGWRLEVGGWLCQSLYRQSRSLRFLPPLRGKPVLSGVEGVKRGSYCGRGSALRFLTLSLSREERGNLYSIGKLNGASQDWCTAARFSNLPCCCSSFSSIAFPLLPSMPPRRLKHSTCPVMVAVV